MFFFAARNNPEKWQNTLQFNVFWQSAPALAAYCFMSLQVFISIFWRTRQIPANFVRISADRILFETSRVEIILKAKREEINFSFSGRNFCLCLHARRRTGQRLDLPL
jgi:hypothetical protein